MLSGSTRTSLVAVLAGLALALASTPVQAAGFALFEQGARGMGFAGAYTAQASDASAIFHNAAGIAFLKGNQLYIGGTLIGPSTDFTGDAPFPGAGQIETMNVGVTPTPAVYFTHQVSERFVAGVGIDTPFGLKTEWANGLHLMVGGTAGLTKESEGGLLRLMLGDAADSRPAGSFVSPSFNLSLRLENPSLPGVTSTVTVMGVKLEEWSYELPEDDFAMENVNFRALFVKVEDASP